MLEFPYRPEPVKVLKPLLSARASYRLRPFAAVRVIGSSGQSRYFPTALLDTGSDNVVFPWTTVAFIRVALLASTQQQLRWHGTSYPLRFANVEMQFFTRPASCRWPAVVGFSSAPLPYPLLGIAGCLEFFDATFRGEDHVVELSPNGTFPGTLQLAP
jgi:hypothetical protein